MQSLLVWSSAMIMAFLGRCVTYQQRFIVINLATAVLTLTISASGLITPGQIGAFILVLDIMVL